MIRSAASDGQQKNSVLGFSSRLEERAEKRKEVLDLTFIFIFICSR